MSGWPELRSESYRDAEAAMEVLRRCGGGRVAALSGDDEGRNVERATMIVLAVGGSRIVRELLPVFGRRHGHRFPALPELQWLDWGTADAVEDAWNAEEARRAALLPWNLESDEEAS